MKTTRKLIVALVLVMSILMTLAVAVIPASAAEDRVVYFSNNKGWKNVYIYCWNDSTGAKNANWPGKAMTYVETNSYGEKIYKYTVSGSYDKIIFTNNSGEQTKNLTLSDYTKNGFYLTGSNQYSVDTYCYSHVGGAAATCTTAQTCKGCGTTITAALGHKWSSATCTAPKTCSTCKATEGTALGHSWVDANCTTPKTCSTCKATEGTALGHSYTPVVTEPTCTAGGYTTYTCECGDSYTGDKTAALDHVDENNDYICDRDGCGTVLCKNHQYTYACDKACTICHTTSRPDAEHDIKHVDANAESCTENGNIEYWYCDICGSAWADEALTQVTNRNNVVIPAAHDLKDVEKKDATCTEAGYTAHKDCSRCDYTEGKEVIPATDHTAGDAATCTTAQTCTVCGDELVAKLGHDLEDVERKDATCTEAGYTAHKDCSRCDYTEGKETIPAAHTYNDKGICTVCGYNRDYMTVYFKNTWNWPDAKVYYWDDNGFVDKAWPGNDMTLLGKDGDYDVYVVLIPRTVKGIIFNGTGEYGFEQSENVTSGYDDCVMFYMEWTGKKEAKTSNNHALIEFYREDATCTDAGIVKYACACGKEHSEEVLETIDHSYTSAETTAPTCTTKGVMTYTCSCGYSYTEDIDATGHTYETEVTAPTCTEAGYTTYTCSCGDSYTDNEVAATGHTIVNGACVCGHVATFEEAITGTGTVTLTGDVEYDGSIVLASGAKIDLNGKNLTVTGDLITFAAGQLIDSVGGGKIYVDQKGIVYNDTNDANVLVYNAEGYYSFKTIKKQSAQATVVDKEGNAVEGKTAIDFRPAFIEGGHYDSFANAEAAGLKMFVSITWDNMPEDKVCKYEATKDLLAAVYANKTSVRLVLVNGEENVEYTITLTIVSDTGCTYTDVLGTVVNGVYTKNN